MYGDIIHSPCGIHATPKLSDVAEVYGENIALSFLQIQINDALTKINVECQDIKTATREVALKIEKMAQRLMVAEWLLVFDAFKADEEVRKQFSLPNVVARIKVHINNVQSRGDKFRREQANIEQQERLAELRKKVYRTKEIPYEDFDFLADAIIYDTDRKWQKY